MKEMKRKRRRNGRRGRDRHSRFSSGFSAKKTDDGTSDSPLQQRRCTKGEGRLHPTVSNRGTKMKRGVGSVKALSSMLDETREKREGQNRSGLCGLWASSQRVLQPDDISLKITHCGVCYADVIWTRNEHGDSKYPLVPGHEIVGIVKEVGSNINRFKIGDHVGVGTYVNSCRDCEYCNDRQEGYCAKGSIFTFNALDVDGTITKGGYSDHIVVHDRYCYKIPSGYPLASAAPLLCAGITVFTPMMHHKMNQPGKSLGVIGLGGLGHMAVKFGKAFGLNVTVLSTSESKKEEALKILGADNFVVSSDKQQMEGLTKSLDFIIDTASGDHPFDPYMSLLKNGGVLALVGFPSEIKLSPASLNIGRKTISGSITGGTTETQEMLDFCAAHKIYPEIEVIDIQYINEALERLVKKDVKYRFVIDIENSLK